MCLWLALCVQRPCQSEVAGLRWEAWSKWNSMPLEGEGGFEALYVEKGFCE